MSSQKGNIERQRPQKHQNRTVFKNNLHDTSQRTKFINSIQISNVCVRCKNIIEWKIKYKKYKPLKQAKTCVTCSQKTIRHAYHVMCVACARKTNVCCKCCQSNDIIQEEPSKMEELKLEQEMIQLTKSMPERQRRTFLRYMKKTIDSNPNDTVDENGTIREKLIEKMEHLKLASDSDQELDFSDSFDEDESEELPILDS